MGVSRRRNRALGSEKGKKRDRFEGVNATNLSDEYSLTSIANGTSTKANISRASHSFDEFTKLTGASDPKTVNASSSKLVINFLSKYCLSGTENALSIDTVNSMIQGLRHVYDQNGHQ